MRDLHVIVSNKIATYLRRDGSIICGPNNYQIVFSFDSEWDAYEKKMARFKWNGESQEVEFTGNTVKVPTLANTTLLEVGVYVEDLSTTTSAQIPCRLSCLCGDEVDSGIVLKAGSASSNGTFKASEDGADGFSEFTVNVPTPEATTEEKTVTPSKSAQTVTPTNADYLSRVKVEAIPEEYVIPSGSESITTNGPHNVSGKATVEVNVPIPEGYIKPEGSIKITENGPVDVTEKAEVIVAVESKGGAELNIAYGETEPTDTSKIWAKTTEPTKVSFRNVFNGAYDGEEIITKDKVLPLGMYNVGGGAVGTNIYLFGGYNDSSYLRSIYKYDTLTDTFTLTTSFSANVCDIACGVVGTDIYLFGGKTGNATYSKNCYKYDTLTNTLTSITSLPVAMYGIACGVVGTDIYLFGGIGENCTNTIYKYDTVTKTRTTLSTTLPVNLANAGCGVVGTDIYLFGGRSATSSGFASKIYKYDTLTDTIEELPITLPSALYSMACEVVGTDIYLLGGTTGYSSTTKGEIYKYDTLTDTLTTSSTTLPMALYSMGYGMVGTDIYLLGGRSGSYVKNDIYKFSPQYSLNENELQLIEAYNTKPLPIISSDSVDINISILNAYKGNNENKAEMVEIYTHNGESWERYC